jgi:hypothetical protein
MKREAIKLFNNSQVRAVWQEDEEKWYFSVIDVITILANPADSRKYWSVLKGRLRAEGSQVTTNCSQFKLLAPDGMMRLTDVLDTEGVLRLAQSVPSPNAESFKRWLAKVGYERIQEIEDPELAQKRMKSLYKAKGYSDSWIEKRVRGIAIREDLTDQWDKTGVKGKKEYAILTSEISRAAFGVTPSEHKALKGLHRENLRDHMTIWN